MGKEHKVGPGLQLLCVTISLISNYGVSPTTTNVHYMAVPRHKRHGMQCCAGNATRQHSAATRAAPGMSP
jgi:hypothetical protein